jgi:hypothetical protein
LATAPRGEHGSATTSTMSRGGPVISLGLFLACCFPYMSPVRTPFDTQPYALIIGMVVVLGRASGKEVLAAKGLVLWPFILTLLATGSWLQHGATLSGFRSMAGYLTVAVVSFAASLTVSSLSGKHLRWIVAVWFLVGAVQRFFLPTFGAAFIVRMSTSPTRGVTSLAAEPSFYAIICVFFLLLNDYFRARGDYGRKSYLATGSIVALCLFLAASGLGFILLAIYLAARAISAGRLFAVVAASIVGIACLTGVFWLYSNVPELQQTRVAQLLSVASQSPEHFIYEDESVSQRAFSIKASHLSLLHSNGLGYGVGTWQTGVVEVVADSGSALSQFGLVARSDRLMSGFGSAIYELGLLGLTIPLILCVATLGARRAAQTRRMAACVVTMGLTVAFVMESAIPLAFPMFGYVLGILATQSAGGTRQGAGGRTGVTNGE